MADDEYDIHKYTDQECFELLNLNNPSDRELEMKILQFMDKYEQKSKRLYHFFESMYDRFFLESESEDAVEGFEYDMKIVQANDTSKLNEQAKDPTLDAIAKTLGNTNAKASSKVIENGTTTISTVTTHNVDYIADPKKLNPVERKTIFKMISIDSQFREDPGNTSATNFTMNLSESIDNDFNETVFGANPLYLVHH